MNKQWQRGDGGLGNSMASGGNMKQIWGTMWHRISESLKYEKYESENMDKYDNIMAISEQISCFGLETIPTHQKP